MTERIDIAPQPQPAGVKEAPARMSGHRLWIDQHLYWWDTPSITGAQIKALASVDPTFGVWQQLEGPVDPRIHNDASVDLPGPTEKRFFTGKLTTAAAAGVDSVDEPNKKGGA